MRLAALPSQFKVRTDMDEVNNNVKKLPLFERLATKMLQYLHIEDPVWTFWVLICLLGQSKPPMDMCCTTYVLLFLVRVLPLWT